jgi:hypothetical protein
MESPLSFVKSPPSNYHSFDASAGFCVFPYALAPPAREWNHIGSDVILAEDLERLVGRRASLVNEIVDALLPSYQFFPLLKRRLAFEHKRRQAPRLERQGERTA